MLRYVICGKTYTNIKTDNRYQVIHLGTHSETCENLVIYVRTKNGENWKHKLALLLIGWASKLLENKVWVRPLGLFEEKFRE